MKLYDSIGPNPHVVRMVAAEKGIALETVKVDLLGGENRRPPYTTMHPGGTLPALELADGTLISEITVIAEYLEELHPEPALIGVTPAERAETRMWVRRIDLGVVEPLATGFRATSGRGLFESRMRLVSAESGAELKALARDRLLWLDGQLAGRTWVCGDRFSLADIMFYAFMAFAENPMVGQPIPEEAGWVTAWFGRVKERPSASA